MVKRKQKSFVIDTNIARSAGAENAIAPTSLHCRNVLRMMTQKRFYVVMSTELRREWKDHASKRSKKWLGQMTKRDRVLDIRNARNEEFREKMRNTAEDVTPKAAKAKHMRDMKKDYHLLEAALVSDMAVLSCEKVCRELYQQAAKTVAEIQPILWVNPDLPGDDAVAWLQRGAPNEKKRRLGYGNRPDNRHSR